MLTRTFLAFTPLLCLVLGCGPQAPDRWESAQKASVEQPKAVSEATLPGATFNKFFPKQEDDIDLVFKQEKLGFAQASVQRGGNLLGMLSISDTRSNPAARDKYKDSTVKIADSPAVSTDQTTSVLVADRFQVQVQSEGEALPAEDRARWIEKFDLAGLAAAH